MTEACLKIEHFAGILAVWTHVDLQQKQDLSIFQIHISDK